MSLNILVVDDQAMIRTIHSQILTETGHRVQTATNGKEGLELFREAQATTPFDLVMTDEEMPVMTGHELAQHLYDEVPGFPIAMISSSNDVDLMVSMMRLGISFFRKPLRKPDLDPFLEATEKQVQVNREREANKEKHDRVDDLIETSSFTLFMGNDPLLPPLIIKYVLDACEKNKISEQVTFRIHFGLEETLINSIAHGNLEIASAEFKKGGDFKLWEDEIQRRAKIPPYCDRKTKIHVHIQREKEVKVSIQDEGKGFDHETVLAKISADDIYQAFGRGIIMLKGMADILEYNQKGNKVYMTFIEPESEDE